MDANPTPPSPVPPQGDHRKWFIAWIAAMVVGPVLFMACVKLSDVMERKQGYEASGTVQMLVMALYYGAIIILPVILGWKLTRGKHPAARAVLTLLFVLMGFAVGLGIGAAVCSTIGAAFM